MGRPPVRNGREADRGSEEHGGESGADPRMGDERWQVWLPYDEKG
jgi:hypothetical protein